ncbi:MAG: PPOX class F420-dependent oxidoreductase [Herbiconiux sp.]|nr:PPOX class F420-dependent oxidoreductase [Herbiconiux sp.]
MTRDSTLDLLGLSDEPYVSLTTFRRSGVGVSTAVWIVRDGDELLVTTSDGTGKVKRLRHDDRVELRPCGRTGRVRDGEPARHGTASVDRSQAAGDAASALFLRKYRLAYRLFLLVERIASRRRPMTRVLLRIRRPLVP